MTYPITAASIDELVIVSVLRCGPARRCGVYRCGQQAFGSSLLSQSVDSVVVFPAVVDDFGIRRTPFPGRP